jgi:hypothetical protein
MLFSKNTKYLDISSSDIQIYLDRDQISAFDPLNTIGFSHNLMFLDIFQFDYLLHLADIYHDHPDDYFITSGAPSASTEFYSTKRPRYCPREALEHLSTEQIRVLLKRPENHDQNFARLFQSIHAKLLQLENGPPVDTIARSETGIFITSAAAITPFHFDPEFGFFSQIEGNKQYHVFSPQAVTRPELERFFVRGVVDIGRLDLESRDPRHEHVFELSPGMGLYQPHNAPHWVETTGTRSISYSFVFQTRAAMATSRVHAFNHYARKMGFVPAEPGLNPGSDMVKASLMRVVTPMRRAVSRAASTLH